MTILICASILIPLLGGLFLNKNRAMLIVTCVLCLAANIALAFFADAEYVLWDIMPSLRVVIGADVISKIFSILMSFTWLMALIYAFGYMEHEENQPRFFRFFMLTLSALMLVCYSGSFAAFFMGFEAMTLLSMPLVLHEQTPDSRAAAMKYIGFSMFGAAAALAAMFAFGAWGISAEFVLGGAIGAAAGEHKTALLVIWLIAVIGFGAKAGMFPLHSWLPTAHPVAPSPASAVLSGLITKCGVLGIIRVTFFLFGVDFLRGTWAQYAAIILALVTVFMGSMMAFGEKLIKKRLAYSTVSQVSYVIFGLMLLNESGFVGGIQQAVFHALAKDALFMWAGAVIHMTGNTYVDDLRGLGRRMPVAMWGFIIASLSLIGIPPTGGFASKWLLAAGALAFDAKGIGLAGVITLIVSALLTAGYLVPIASKAFFPGKENYELPAPKCEAKPVMTVPIMILAILTVVLGLFPNLISGLVSGIM